MSDELKRLADNIQKAMHDMQSLHNQWMKAQETGIGDIRGMGQKLQNIEAHIEEMKTRWDTLNKQTESMTAQMAGLMVGGNGNKSDEKERLRRHTELFMAGKKSVSNERVTEDDIEAYAAYEKAFGKLLRTDSKAFDPADFKSLMQVGSDPDGGYWVPVQMQMDIIQKIHETSPMRQICDVLTILTDSVTWPNDVNDLTSGGFVGETETRGETATPETGETTIYVREQYAMPIVTQKLLDMASLNVEAWLSAKIADKFRRVENNRFVVGTGVKAPRGFLDYSGAAVTTDDATRAWGVIQYVPSGAAGAFPKVSGSVADDPNSLITLISKVKPDYLPGAVFVMNRATEASVRKLKDADGRYLVGFGDLRDNARGFNLLGYPIANAEDMPNVASNSFSIAFGNFRVGYQIVDGRGMRMLRDPYTTKGRVKFYTTKWTGGDLLNSDAIKLMKFATT